MSHVSLTLDQDLHHKIGFLNLLHECQKPLFIHLAYTMDRLDQATCHSSKKWGFFLKFLQTGILPLSWSRYLCDSKGRLQEALDLPLRISSRKCMTLSFNGCRTQLGVKPSLSLSWAPQTRLELESLALFAPWMHDRCWIIIFFFPRRTFFFPRTQSTVAHSCWRLNQSWYVVCSTSSY